MVTLFRVMPVGTNALTYKYFDSVACFVHSILLSKCEVWHFKDTTMSNNRKEACSQTQKEMWDITHLDKISLFQLNVDIFTSG